jgi:hypothetical protein
MGAVRRCSADSARRARRPWGSVDEPLVHRSLRAASSPRRALRLTFYEAFSVDRLRRPNDFLPVLPDSVLPTRIGLAAGVPTIANPNQQDQPVSPIMDTEGDRPQTAAPTRLATARPGVVVVSRGAPPGTYLPSPELRS